MDVNNKKIYDKLNDLMEMQGAFMEDFPGKPFVNSEKEFGISMIPLRGGLYAMHHLIDSFNVSEFFKGERKPATNLDDMVYNFRLDVPVEIYKGVIALFSKDSMSLTISTEHSVETILVVIEAGIDRAKAKAKDKLELSKKLKEDFVAEVISEFEKEEALPLYGDGVDIKYIGKYITLKANKYFSSDPDVTIHEDTISEKTLCDDVILYADYGVKNNRQRATIEMKQTEPNLSLLNEFARNVLSSVFTGINAVGASSSPHGVSIELKGNFPRLVRDIGQNDPVSAKIISDDMGLSLNKGYN